VSKNEHPHLNVFTVDGQLVVLPPDNAGNRNKKASRQHLRGPRGPLSCARRGFLSALGDY